VEIVHELITKATPEKVFQALTEPAHLASWFAEDTHAEPLVGSVAEFRFDRGTIRVEVTDLELERSIAWNILEGMPGWEGITGDVRWELEPNPFGAGTMIHFRHSGWPTMEGPYPSVNFRWAWFITRMQSYLEKGVASPAR
jgi:uncharacterized protein YndB with AHSA1/START domain